MIINFSHQKGGTGKSTIAYNTAKVFIDRGYKVKLLDLDIQNTCVSLNELREVPLDYIINVVSDELLIELINKAKEDEIIIIDSGGFDSSLTRLAIMGADINITPVADKVTEILAVIKKYSFILEEIEQQTNEKVNSYVLLNKIHLFASNFNHIIDMIENQKRLKLITSLTEEGTEVPLVIRERAIYDKSLIEGKTVFETPKLKGHEDASNEINRLADQLLKLIKGN